MRFLRNPWFWLFLGTIGFHFITYSADIMVLYILSELGLLSRLPVYMTNEIMSNWDGTGNSLTGFTLGIVSAACAALWNLRQFANSRLLALFGGVIIGVAWFAWIHKNLIEPYLWVRVSGHLAPPLLWAIGLVIFALFARPERAESSNSTASQ